MEVTTVSPSPASLTEGDDLCETDVTNVAIHIVTLLISLCGLAGNRTVLWFLSLKSRNSGIFNLAFADFLFLLFMVPSVLLFLVEDVSCSSIMPLMYVSFLFQLSVVSYFWGLYQLTRSSDVANMFDLCKLYCRYQLPLHLLWIVDSVQYWAFFSLFTVIPMVTPLCPSHKQGQCQAVLFSMYIIVLLLFAAPMVISSTIDIIRAKCGSRNQQSKKRNIVIFIIVLFTLLLSLCNFLQQLGYIPVPTQVVFLLTCIHSSIKSFICFLAGSCWRPCSVGSLWLSLQRIFEEPEKNSASIDGPAMDAVL